MEPIREVAYQLKDAVVRTGVIRRQDSRLAARVICEELKALLYGEKYAQDRELMKRENGHADGMVFMLTVNECVRRILAERTTN